MMCKLHRESDHDLHRRWTAAVGTSGYDKEHWKRLERELYAACRTCCLVEGSGEDTGMTKVADATKQQTKEQLTARRLALIEDLAAIGQAPLDTAEGRRREEVVADLRNTNAAIKRLHVDEARRAKSEADRRRARGLAEQQDNLLRAQGVVGAGVVGAAPLGAAPMPASRVQQARGRPAGQTPGEFLLWQATRVRKTIRGFNHPLPFTVEFSDALDRFIEAQTRHVAEYASARDRGAGPDEWRQTWKDEAGHHYREDLACPACGTDSSSGCVVMMSPIFEDQR